MSVSPRDPRRFWYPRRVGATSSAARLAVSALFVGGCGRIAYDPFPADSGSVTIDTTKVVDTPDVTLDGTTDVNTTDVNTTDLNTTDLNTPSDVLITTRPSTEVDRDLGLWRAPTLVPVINSSAQDDDPTLTGDMLEIVFNSDRNGGGDIWHATRARVSDPWDAPSMLDVSSTSNETAPKLSPDGLTLYFNSDRMGASAGGDIFVSTRSARTQNWSVPTLVTELSSPEYDSPPMTFDRGLRGMFSTTRGTTNGNDDLFAISRNTVGEAWGLPIIVSELITATAERQPWVAQDGLVLYFDSSRNGDFNLYRATRTTATGTFGTPTPITEVNSTFPDQDVWVSPDLRVMYFSSERDGRQQIYTSSR